MKVMLCYLSMALTPVEKKKYKQHEQVSLLLIWNELPGQFWDLAHSSRISNICDTSLPVFKPS